MIQLFSPWEIQYFHEGKNSLRCGYRIRLPGWWGPPLKRRGRGNPPELFWCRTSSSTPPTNRKSKYNYKVWRRTSFPVPLKSSVYKNNKDKCGSTDYEKLKMWLTISLLSLSFSRTAMLLSSVSFMMLSSAWWWFHMKSYGNWSWNDTKI